MTSPDTTRTAYGNEMEAEIGWAFARYLSAKDAGAVSYGLVRAAVEPVIADLIAAREERDEWKQVAKVEAAERRRLSEQLRESTLDHLARDVGEEQDAANLIALAKMYGEACGELANLRGYAARANESFGISMQAVTDKWLTAEAERDSLRIRLQEAERATEAWKRVAVIAAIPLEAMRMAGSYRALAPSTQTSVDEAVVTIRMAVTGHSLPPEGDIDTCLAPARAALTAPVPATEEAGAWPSGCIKPGSCSRNRQCQYVQTPACRHLGKDLTAEIEAAALKEQEG